MKARTRRNNQPGSCLHNVTMPIGLALPPARFKMFAPSAFNASSVSRLEEKKKGLVLIFAVPKSHSGVWSATRQPTNHVTHVVGHREICVPYHVPIATCVFVSNVSTRTMGFDARHAQSNRDTRSVHIVSPYEPRKCPRPSSMIASNVAILCAFPIRHYRRILLAYGPRPCRNHPN